VSILADVVFIYGTPDVGEAPMFYRIDADNADALAAAGLNVAYHGSIVDVGVYSIVNADGAVVGTTKDVFVG
jgi:hypothetical protein